MARVWDDMDRQALDWVMRTGEPDFAEWDAFTDWLEADPAHAARYHALGADAADMADLLPANDPEPVAKPSRRGWIAGALAAGIVAVVGYGALRPTADPYIVQTAPGVTRAVTLADGSSIMLNGGTRLTLDHRDQRRATVETGQALFAIRHDDAHPFRVSVGGGDLVDLGTTFDITRSDGGTRIAVSEGAAEYRIRSLTVALPAGRGLRMADGDGTIIQMKVDRTSVGGWKQGRIDYDGAPLRDVAADLSRSLGTKITASPAVAQRPFRGTLLLSGLARDPSRAAPLLGVTMRRNGTGWEMAAPP